MIVTKSVSSGRVSSNAIENACWKEAISAPKNQKYIENPKITLKVLYDGQIKSYEEFFSRTKNLCSHRNNSQDQRKTNYHKKIHFKREQVKQM